MNQNKPAETPQSEYSLIVQIIAFPIFWALPTLWLDYLCSAVFNVDTQGLLLLAGMVVLNLATYSCSRALSTVVNGSIFQALIVLQLFAWIFR